MLDHRVHLSGLRCTAPGPFQFCVREQRRSQSSKHVHRFSYSSRGRSDCLDHTVSPLACRRGTSPRQLPFRFAAVIALSFLHDVQPISISQFQSGQLEDEEIYSALSSHYSYSHLHWDELRVDASRSAPNLLAIRSAAAMAFTRMAARNRRRDRRRTIRTGRASALTIGRHRTPTAPIATRTRKRIATWRTRVAMRRACAHSLMPRRAET